MDEKYTLLYQGSGYLQNFTADNIEVEKLKTGNISNYLIPEESYCSFKSYGYLMNSFKFIYCFLSKQSKMSFSFTCNLLFKHNNMEMVVHSQLGKISPSSVKILENAGPLGQKLTFFILLSLTTTKYC